MKYTCKFNHFNINQIKPTGWLKRQLEIQAEGLSSKLPEFWPDIKNSAWIGGDMEGWERVPYWLDGFIALAWQLDKPELKQTAERYIHAIVNSQEPDGWIAPTKNRAGYDMWAYFLILKALVVYHRSTGDNNILNCIYKALKICDKHIERHTLSAWGQTRWFEALIPIYYTYKYFPEEWLISLAIKLRTSGADWKALFEIDFPYKSPAEKNKWTYFNHVVNNAMMIKGNTLYSAISNKQDDYDFCEKSYAALMKYHGMANGIFSGDECLSGLSPFQGTELCAVAELMYSCELMAAFTGNPIWGDRLEQLAFNTFPATFTPDMNNHQYDQQVNQPWCISNLDNNFSTNGHEANLFGVEPNYGCCTANMHQAFPKFASSLFMEQENGIVVMSYSPAVLTTTINNTPVSIEMKTNYPFEDNINFIIKCEKAVEFKLSLRIPQWCVDPICELNNTAENGYIHITKNWNNLEEFKLTLPMKPVFESRPNNSMVLKRGPLLYSLYIEEEYKKQNKPNLEWWHENFELYNKSKWNYSFANLDTENLCFKYHGIDKYPFNPNTPPITVLVPCREIDWEVNNLVPVSNPDRKTAADDVTYMKFIPYGCTMLRMTELPYIPL
ncbi:glycoside hydrolase family 127 protein [Eubacteriales bacterium OttesenSCG-928-G02]|nr:glycoside hydrolase family 127 protein [Eubacteriales bacterium OttesenSCG-928-G02]